MLSHLIESYGCFTETERREVASRMDVPWEGGPLEFVIQQIRDLLAQQKTDKLYDLVKESGLLSNACQRWRMLPTAEKTWAAATVHDFQQYANNHDEELTTETAGYQWANHVQINSNTGTLGDITSQLANQAARDKSGNTEFQALQAELAANKVEAAVTKAMFTAYKEANKGRGNNGGTNQTVVTINGGGNNTTNNN
jgi:hypothetical protein